MPNGYPMGTTHGHLKWTFQSCWYFLTCEHMNFAIYWCYIFPFWKWNETIYFAKMEICYCWSSGGQQNYIVCCQLCVFAFLDDWNLTGPECKNGQSNISVILYLLSPGPFKEFPWEWGWGKGVPQVPLGGSLVGVLCRKWPQLLRWLMSHELSF